MAHFDEMTCMQYLDGQLDRVRAAELTAHAESCPECKRLLSALEQETRLLRESLVEEDEAVPARLLALPSREAVPWAWISALGLALAGLYTVWTQIVEPWQNELGRAGFGESNLLSMLLFGGVFWKGWSDMQNLVQLLATVTLVGLGVFLVGRGWRRWTTVAMVLSGLVAALLLPPLASAADIRRGKQTFVLAEDEVFKNDLIVTAATVRIDGTIEGDLIVFAQSVTINGHVTGDVIGFGQKLLVNGTVDGNVRVFANTATLGGTVAHNVTAFGDNLEFESKSQVNGGLIVFGGILTLDGHVNRDLLAYGRQAFLSGFIGGDTLYTGERLNIAATAEIKGKTKYRGRRPAEVEEGAKLASPVEFEEHTERPDYASPRFYWHQALRWGAGLVFGMVFLLLFPAFFRESVRAGDRPGASAAAGLATFFLVPIVAIIACCTLVGLAVGIGGMLLWIIAIYGANIFFATWLGNKAMGAADTVGALLGRMAVGLVILRVAWNVPYVGGWIWFVVTLLGLGAFTLAIYNRVRPPLVV